MYKVTVVKPDGVQQTELTENPDCYSLMRALEKCEIKSFIVSLSPVL